MKISALAVCGALVFGSSIFAPVHRAGECLNYSACPGDGDGLGGKPTAVQCYELLPDGGDGAGGKPLFARGTDGGGNRSTEGGSEGTGGKPLAGGHDGNGNYSGGDGGGTGGKPFAGGLDGRQFFLIKINSALFAIAPQASYRLALAT